MRYELHFTISLYQDRVSCLLGQGQVIPDLCVKLSDSYLQAAHQNLKDLSQDF